MSNISIIGGGLAGLVSALLLKRAGHDVLLIERKAYPFHRVCGEYISNEVRPFMERQGFLPDIALPHITQFALSSTSGKTSFTTLDLGGFGVSRYTLDHHLVELAQSEGVTVKQAKVQDVIFKNNQFTIHTDAEQLTAQYVIGAYGKRSNLDQVLQRPFFSKRSPYIGVKYHARIDHPIDQIALHNFPGGYCGISQVENGVTNICYLGSRNELRKYGNIPDLEANVLFQNPHLKRIFSSAEFLWDKPEVINEISFEIKRPIDNHIFMCGDAAGMITPLCGNGMAMAIHSAKLLAETLTEGTEKNWSREIVEDAYALRWSMLFKQRLWFGRQVQRLFGQPTVSNIAVHLVNHVKPLSRAIIRGTHGKVIV